MDGVMHWSTVGGCSLVIMTIGIAIVFSLVFPAVSGIVRQRNKRYRCEGPMLFLCSDCPDCKEKNADRIASIQKLIQQSQSRLGKVVAVEDAVNNYCTMKTSNKEVIKFSEVADKDAIYAECAETDRNETATYDKMRAVV